MTRAKELLEVVIKDGYRSVNLVRDVYDSLDAHQKAEFEKLYSRWFLLARKEYAKNVGIDCEDYVYCTVESFDTDEEFQKAYDTEHTIKEFLDYYEADEFDEIPELEEIVEEYDKTYLEYIIASDFECAPFLIATDYYGEASQFVDVVHMPLSTFWNVPAPKAYLDADYLFLTEVEELIDNINTDSDDVDDRILWINLATNLIGKFPRVDIERVYKWFVEDLREPLYALKWVKISESSLIYEYEGTHMYSLAA